jgi:hypothetical protein
MAHGASTNRTRSSNTCTSRIGKATSYATTAAIGGIRPKAGIIVFATIRQSSVAIAISGSARQGTHTANAQGRTIVRWADIPAHSTIENVTRYVL